MEGDKVRLHLSPRAGSAAAAGAPSSLVVDHVVAATGFRIDMSRLPFLDDGLLSGLRMDHGAPVLSRNFETSVPGLYVVGPAAAYSFGPVMRFVFGAGFAVPRVARHLIARAAGSGNVVNETKVRELAAVR
jgi:thioredoxin reductase